MYALILAGGGGTRLWPRSRNSEPKQFIKLFEDKTLTQITAHRFSKILPWERIYCVTVSEAYKKEILKEIPLFVPQNIIVEPARRETAPAHGIGAVYIHAKDPDAVIITESADRLVSPVHEYLKTLTRAAKVAYEDKVMIAIGVKPRYPNTGYGHIKRGVRHKKVDGIGFYKLEKFVEKPPLALAKRYTASGKYYWNAGQFVWRAADYIQALNTHEPAVGKIMQEIADAIGTSNEKAVITKSYEQLPTKTTGGNPMSVDYAVCEKEKNFMLVVADFYWTDIGDWKEVWENLKKDEEGNVVIHSGNHEDAPIIFDTTETLVHTQHRKVALVGVDNIIVIDTPDALLVVNKGRAQSVKQVVEKLKEAKRTDLL